jgi:Icc protein
MKTISFIKTIKTIIMVSIILLISVPGFADDTFSFRFAVLSDAHIDTDAKDDPAYFKLLNQSEDILRTAIDELNALNKDENPSNDIDFVLFSGDTANSRWAEEYTLLREILTKLEIPFYMVDGDWDFSPDYSPRLVYTYYDVPHLNLDEHIMYDDSALVGVRKYDYSVDFANSDGDIIHIIGMDNVLHFDGSRGSYEPEQIEWLKTDLDSNRDKPVVIFQHCPVLSPYLETATNTASDAKWIPFTKRAEQEGVFAPNTFTQDLPGKKDRAADRSEDFLDLVEQFKVPLVITGDYHVNKKIPYPSDNPVSLITINPALVSYPCAYAMYTYSNDKITWETKRIEKYAVMSEQYNRASLEAYNKVYEKLSADQFLFNIDKSLSLSWGSDVGESNDWFGWFSLANREF